MKAGIAGYGVWARGLEGVKSFEASASADFSSIAGAEFLAPKPEAVPPKERRRAGLMINLAVEVAHQACENAGIDKTQIPSVFVSALGDTAITDYMCRKLAEPEKLLSPTKFHNSVHNAPSGYWTISAENRAPSSFVGGFRESFGAGLLEAVSQAHAYSVPVLLVAYDIANNAPFKDIESIEETLAIALVVTNGDARGSGDASNIRCCEIEYQTDLPETWSSSQPQSENLRVLSQANPVGCGLAVIEAMGRKSAAKQSALCLPAAPGAALQLEFLQEVSSGKDSLSTGSPI